MTRHNRRSFLGLLASSPLVAGSTTEAIKENTGDSQRSHYQALAKQHGSIMIVGLSADEERSYFDGHTCVNSFRSGIVFCDGSENDYTRPMLYVGPDGEPMKEPLGFAREWHCHAIGQHYYDPL